jgi:hypothetical protein
MAAPIVIIGMSRSGTTLVCALLDTQPEVHLETEPHMLWKAGSFAHLADDDVEDDATAAAFIRHTLLTAAGEGTLVEKSPVNCLRPDLVHRVFPDARVVYVDRQPQRCIDSNYRRTLKQESLKPSIVLRKYLAPRRHPDRDFGSHLDAAGGRPLHQQVRPRDWVPFVGYTARLMWLRQREGALPFGPKMKGFAEMIRTRGPLEYHVEVYRVAQERKARFEELYGDRLASFRLEELQREPDEVARLYAFCGFRVDRSDIETTIKGLDQDIVARASLPGPDDAEILRLMRLRGVA